MVFNDQTNENSTTTPTNYSNLNTKLAAMLNINSSKSTPASLSASTTTTPSTKVLSSEDKKINLNALKNQDPFATNILDTAQRVAVYKFLSKKNEWKKLDVEGSLFLFERMVEPLHSFVVMNTLALNLFLQPITSDLEFQDRNPFLLYKSNNDIFGIWFLDKDDCERVKVLIMSLTDSAKDRRNKREQSKLVGNPANEQQLSPTSSSISSSHPVNTSNTSNTSSSSNNSNNNMTSSFNLMTPLSLLTTGSQQQPQFASHTFSLNQLMQLQSNSCNETTAPQSSVAQQSSTSVKSGVDIMQLLTRAQIQYNEQASKQPQQHLNVLDLLQPSSHSTPGSDSNVLPTHTVNPILQKLLDPSPNEALSAELKRKLNIQDKSSGVLTVKDFEASLLDESSSKKQPTFYLTATGSSCLSDSCQEEEHSSDTSSDSSTDSSSESDEEANHHRPIIPLLLTPAAFESCSSASSSASASSFAITNGVTAATTTTIAIKHFSFEGADMGATTTTTAKSLESILLGGGKSENNVNSATTTPTPHNSAVNLSEMALMSKQQLQQVLINLLSNDDQFLSSLHNAYIKSNINGININNSNMTSNVSSSSSATITTANSGVNTNNSGAKLVAKPSGEAFATTNAHGYKKQQPNHNNYYLNKSSNQSPNKSTGGNGPTSMSYAKIVTK